MILKSDGVGRANASVYQVVSRRRRPPPPGAAGDFKVGVMGALVAVLLIALVLFAIGFVVKLLWIAAAVVLAVWLVGFVAHGAEGRRWYRW